MTMTHGDIGRLLGLAASRDRRTVGKADILAWHEDLGDLDFDTAREAISRHYRESTDWIMPAHIRRLAADVIRDHRRAIRQAEEQRAIEAHESVPRGTLTDRSAEIQAFVGKVRSVMPEGDREALAPRQVAWEREHRAFQRQQESVPNPAFDPAMGYVPEWNASKTPPPGAWWEDTDARERHAKTLLAEAGRLRPRGGDAQ